MDKKIIIINTTIYDIDDVLQGKVKKGDFIEYNNEIYVFDGYEFGNKPIVTHVKTNQQIELPTH
jgi:hypothetical protein